MRCKRTVRHGTLMRRMAWVSVTAVAVGLGPWAGLAPTASGNPAATRGWQPPVRPLQVIKSFRPPASDWLPGHRGVDLRTRPGQAVHSAGAGRVAYASRLAGRGVVVVDHGALRTTYEPVAASVAVGARVNPGDRIGQVAPGSGHCGSGACLHMGLKRGSTYLDPRLLIFGMRVVLRPL